MVPSYKDNEWQVVVRQPKVHPNGVSTGSVIQIRVLEGTKWRDYWIPPDPKNSDYVQYQEWLADGNEPRLIF